MRKDRVVLYLIPGQSLGKEGFGGAPFNAQRPEPGQLAEVYICLT